MAKEGFIIELKDLKFFSKIGVIPQEREIGNEFLVYFYAQICSVDFVEEDLSTSISYADIYEVIKDEMSIESLLLESVAKRIGNRIIGMCNNIEMLRVKIVKTSPPIIGIQGSCGVEYFYKKN